MAQGERAHDHPTWCDQVRSTRLQLTSIKLPSHLFTGAHIMAGGIGSRNVVTCKFCGKKSTLSQAEIDSDLMTCTGTPLRRCDQIIPTGREDEIRDKMEQWVGGSLRAYPQVAVARAIGYAAG